MKLVVLLSGKGSNLLAIIRAIEEKRLNACILAVLSDRQDAAGLELARVHQIETHFIDPKLHSSREHYDHALCQRIDHYQPDYVILAGFMRILSAHFVRHFQGKLLNIHPSLLPKFKGLNTHQRAIEAKENWHGCSVHFVNEELDGGPIIARRRIAIEENESSDNLKNKVQALEHQLYPQVLIWLEQGLVKLDGSTLVCDASINDERNVEPDYASGDTP